MIKKIFLNLFKPQKIFIAFFRRIKIFINSYKFKEDYFEKKQEKIFENLGLDRSKGIQKLETIKKKLILKEIEICHQSMRCFFLYIFR